MPLDEGALLVDDLVDTEVGVEVGLDVLEEGDRAVGTSTTAYPRVSEWPTSSGGRHLPEHTAGSVGLGDTNGIVEGQTKGLVDLLAALAAVEQVLLDVVANGEQSAASGVGRGVHTVRASDPTGEGAC